MWVGQAEFIYFLGELSWGSGFIYIFPYPPILNISNGENGQSSGPISGTLKDERLPAEAARLKEVRRRSVDKWPSGEDYVQLVIFSDRADAIYLAESASMRAH